MAEPDGAVEEFGNVLAALADPTRRRLLDLLAAQGAATATTLTGRLPISRQAIVKHLAVLDAAGLVVGSRAGREVRYALRPAALDATTRWMSWLAADWDRRLAAVKRAAETAEHDSALQIPSPQQIPRRTGTRGAAMTPAANRSQLTRPYEQEIRHDDAEAHEHAGRHSLTRSVRLLARNCAGAAARSALVPKSSMSCSDVRRPYRPRTPRAG
jgi:DNA-binding transcriptional ArsR family regulator